MEVVRWLNKKPVLHCRTIAMRQSPAVGPQPIANPANITFPITVYLIVTVSIKTNTIRTRKRDE